MAYRFITMIGALLLVAMLFGFLWLFCRWFLVRHGAVEPLPELTMRLATWIFAGISVGLLGVVFGAFLLGPWAFYLALKNTPVVITDSAAVWWGFGIVTAALTLTTAVAFVLLYAVGAL